MENFSARLRLLRKERGLKQREMAEICGLKLRSYQDYEYQVSYPSALGLVALADFFGVSWTISWAAPTSGRSTADRPQKDKIRPPLVIKWNETLL